MIGEQWRVPEHLVKNVGLLQVVQLFATPDEGGGGKLALRQQGEKAREIDEGGHGRHGPAGVFAQPG
ncbi:hypothetical protein D3C83_96920 [compost metagenome]